MDVSVTNFEWHLKKKVQWFFPPHHEKLVQRQTALNRQQLWMKLISRCHQVTNGMTLFFSLHSPLWPGVGSSRKTPHSLLSYTERAKSQHISSLPFILKGTLQNIVVLPSFMISKKCNVISFVWPLSSSQEERKKMAWNFHLIVMQPQRESKPQARWEFNVPHHQNWFISLSSASKHCFDR